MVVLSRTIVGLVFSCRASAIALYMPFRSLHKREASVYRRFSLHLIYLRISVIYMQDLPSVSQKALFDILSKSNSSITVDRDICKFM